MRLYMLPLFAALTLGLGGCAGKTTDQTVAEIRQATTLACSFVPTFATVSAILATFGVGQLVVVSEIATGICQSISTVGARRGVAAPRYRGVAIKGSRV